MKLKVFITLALLTVVAGASGCSIKPAEEPTVPAAAPTAATTAQAVTETTTQETTTVPETTAEATTAPEKVTEAEEETSAKRTEKTAAANTTAKFINGKGVFHRDEIRSENLKYGVSVSRTIDVAYQIVSLTKETVVGEIVEDETYNRVGYKASYSELLPAAKKNKSNYSGYIQDVVDIVNRWRRNEGLKALKLDSTLTETANVRAEELAWSGKHSHRRPDGRYFDSIFKDKGFTAGRVGENLGWNFSSPEAVCQAWKESPTHYKNIMDPNFTRIGVGVADDPDPTQTLCWVQHFSGNSLE